MGERAGAAGVVADRSGRAAGVAGADPAAHRGEQLADVLQRIDTLKKEEERKQREEEEELMRLRLSLPPTEESFGWYVAEEKEEEEEEEEAPEDFL